MFITDSFDDQLEDLLKRVCIQLHITSSQHQLAKQHYSAIGKWLADKESPLSVLSPTIYAQGSFLIGTTVKPLGREEFDLDLVFEMQVDFRKIGNPGALLDAVEARLKQHDIYRTRIQRKRRCIRVQYANEFHLDILPACPDLESGNGCLVVPDRQMQTWKPSNPKGYAQWFESRAHLFRDVEARKIEPLPPESAHSMRPLKHAVQLTKRWRDIRFFQNQNLAPISIVLTTLAGTHYRHQPTANEALTGILDGIIRSIPRGGERLVVVNPSNPKEDLSERWDQDRGAYDAFLWSIAEFHEGWMEVKRQRGIPQVAKFLKLLFGEKLAEHALREQANSIQDQRSSNRLGVRGELGVIGSAASGSTIPIRQNTFYGD